VILKKEDTVGVWLPNVYKEIRNKFSENNKRGKMDIKLQEFLLKINDFKVHTSITREVNEGEYDVYRHISKEYKPESIFEVGVLFGFSAVSMLWGGIDTVKEYVGLDIESLREGSNAIAIRNMKLTLRKFSKAENNISFQVVKKVKKEILKKRFDLVHIDGDHSFEACLFDLSLYYPMAKKFVLVHDYYSKANPEVKPAIAEFEKRIGGFKKIQIFNSTQGLFLIEK